MLCQQVVVSCQIQHKRYNITIKEVAYNSENMFTNVHNTHTIHDTFLLFLLTYYFRIAFLALIIQPNNLAIMPVTSADVGSSCLRCLEALVFVDFHIAAIPLHFNTNIRRRTPCTHSSILFNLYTCLCTIWNKFKFIATCEIIQSNRKEKKAKINSIIQI